MLYCQSVYYAHLDLAYIHSSMPRPAILAHTKSLWRWCHGSHAPVGTQHCYIVCWGSRGQFGSGDKQRYGVGSKDAGINTELTRAENGLETQFLFGVA